MRRFGLLAVLGLALLGLPVEGQLYVRPPIFYPYPPSVYYPRRMMIFYPPPMPMMPYSPPSDEGDRQGGAVVDVGAYDNAFYPAVMTVSVGTLVQWTNQGRHQHTITSEGDQWEDHEIGPGGIYAHAFSRPGVYPYYCSLHAHEMRGTIVVK